MKGSVISGGTESRVRLRPMVGGDQPRLFDWRCRPESAANFFSPAPQTLSEQLAWFKRYRRRGDGIVYVLEEKTHDRYVLAGCMALYHIDKAARRAEIGRILLPAENRGRGLATEGLSLLLDHAFGPAHRGLDSVYLEVWAANTPAIALYLRCDFRLVGAYMRPNLADSGIERPVLRMERRRQP